MARAAQHGDAYARVQLAVLGVVLARHAHRLSRHLPLAHRPFVLALCAGNAALRARSRVTEAEALLDPAGMGGFTVFIW